jgi:hypothetical protein
MFMFSSKWSQCRGNKGEKSVSQSKADLLKKTIIIVFKDREKKLMFLLSKKDDEKHATIIKIG